MYYINNMSKQKKQLVKFKATQTIKKPTKVSFRTKDGKPVSFSAQKAVKVQKTVTFKAKKR